MPPNLFRKKTGKGMDKTTYAKLFCGDPFFRLREEVPFFAIDFAGFVWFEISSGAFMLYGRFLRTEVTRQIFLPTITAWHWIVEDAWHFWVVCQDDNMTWHDIIWQDTEISQMASSFFRVKSPNNSTQQQGPKHFYKTLFAKSGILTPR